MELRIMEYYLAVVREGNISAAVTVGVQIGISEIAATVSGCGKLLSEPVVMLKQNDESTRFRCRKCGCHSRCAASDYRNPFHF